MRQGHGSTEGVAVAEGGRGLAVNPALGLCPAAGTPGALPPLLAPGLPPFSVSTLVVSPAALQAEVRRVHHGVDPAEEAQGSRAGQRERAEDTEQTKDPVTKHARASLKERIACSRVS